MKETPAIIRQADAQRFATQAIEAAVCSWKLRKTSVETSCFAFCIFPIGAS